MAAGEQPFHARADGGEDLRRVLVARWGREVKGEVVAVVLGLSSGCATIRRHDTLETEQMLSAAGFHMKLADTPEKLAHLQTLTPRRLVRHSQANQFYYVYADPEVCRCLYAGTETQYQAYLQLALQKRRADEELMAAQDNLNASMNWGMWGPWPWY